MNRKSEIIEIAKNAVEAEGWPWQQPVVALRRRRWVLFGPAHWEVITFADHRGGNVFLMIDDKTGRVFRKSFRPY
jgi:hypothetical protein